MATDVLIHPQMDVLCLTEKLLNSSIKQLLGVSPNTILYGDAIPTEHTLLAEIDNTPFSNEDGIMSIL